MEKVTLKELRIILDSNEVKNYFQIQKVKIKEEVVSDDEPTDDLQPISQVYSQEYQIKSEVDSTTLAVEQFKDKHIGTKTRFSCSHCEKNNMVLGSFKQHLTGTHHLSKEEILKYVPEFYECKYCHCQFKTPSLLKRHVDTHTLPYKCDICGKRFALKCSLKSHKFIHSSERQFPCSHCDKNFRQKSTLAEHLKSIHNGVVHKCDQCEKKFKCRNYLVRHIKFIHNRQSFWKCDECGKFFTYKYNLKIHIIAVHLTVSKSYLCPFCSKTFKFSVNLKRHIKTKHNSVVHIESNDWSIQPRTYSKPCKDPNAEPVGQLLTLQNQLNIKEEISEDDGPELQLISEVYLQDFHEENIKTEENYPLEFADEVETTDENVVEIKTEITIDEMDLSTLEESSEGLSVSSQNETSAYKQVQVMQAEDKHEVKTPRYSCSLCKKDFLLFRNLIVHLIQIHHLSEEVMLKYYPVFECKFCHSRFETLYKLHCHEITHTLPFKCDICDERFGQKSRLTTHKLRHTESKFTCPHCDMKFRYETHLKKHLESLHSVFLYTCNKCGKVCKQKRDLTHHIKTVHEGLSCRIRKTSWECDKCNKCFRLKTYLKSHQREVHESVPANNCLYCGVKFNVIQDLKQHIETQHGETNQLNSISKSTDDSNNCIVPKFIITYLATPAVGSSLIKIQNFNPDIKIKEEILDGTEIQPISQVFVQEYQEEHIKTEVNSPLDSTLLNGEVESTITTENDV